MFSRPSADVNAPFGARAPRTAQGNEDPAATLEGGFHRGLATSAYFRRAGTQHSRNREGAR